MELNNLAIAILLVVFVAVTALESYAKHKYENSEIDK